MRGGDAMSWMMQNGSYPYLDGVEAFTDAFTKAGSVNIWQCGAGNVPECSRFSEVPAFGCFANAENLHTIRYRGTAAQWNAIAKGAQWHEHAAADRVICADETVMI